MAHPLQPEKVWSCAQFRSRQHGLFFAHRTHYRQQISGVEVENTLGIFVVPSGYVIASECQHVTDTESGGAEQVTLDRYSIPIAASHLHDRFYIHLLEMNSGGKAGHTDLGTGSICQIYG